MTDTALVESPTLVLLTGPSSAGKSTVAAALQRLTQLPAVFLPGDALELPEDCVSRQRLRRLAVEDAVAVQLALDRAYVEALARFVANGFHAIGEVIFKDRIRTDIYRAGMADVRSLLVRLTCTDEERRARELARGDRPLGLSDETSAVEIRVPGLVLDTTEKAPDDIAKAIWSALAQAH